MAKAEKLDLYREHKSEYVTPKKPVLVEVGLAQYLAVSGEGAPASKEFQSAVGALYSVAFTVKMTRKFAGLGDYKVANLEGLWWIDKKDANFLSVPPERWRWKLLIRVPEFVTARDLDEAKESLRKKKKPPEFEEVTLETIREGLCVQVLHVGPYATEPETVRAMENLAAENGLAFHEFHHEIYLSDPRRVPAEKLRTILRHPVKKA